jgi:DNA polymerase I-like protein with 3'-5' exonuclease and polymerase domains
LWSLIRLNDWLKQNKLKSRIIAEIHDSMLMYFYRPEIDAVIQQAQQIMTEEIREYWKWIIVPLGIEVELAAKGGSWADKKPYHLS